MNQKISVWLCNFMENQVFVKLWTTCHARLLGSNLATSMTTCWHLLLQPYFCRHIPLMMKNLQEWKKVSFISLFNNWFVVSKKLCHPKWKLCHNYNAVVFYVTFIVWNQHYRHFFGYNTSHAAWSFNSKWLLRMQICDFILSWNNITSLK